MISFEHLAFRVLQWAKPKGLLGEGNALPQYAKTLEEVVELFEAIAVSKDKDSIKDAIGDIFVTLIIQAHIQGLDPVECLNSVYEEINKRTGKTVNGVFIKDDITK